MLSSLQPQKIWHFFDEICQIPRPSKNEEAIISYIQLFAKSRNLECKIDSVGNLVIVKESTDKETNRPTVVMQAHLDMVCEKESNCNHNFLTDAIKPIIKDGWVMATGTTLGADNGIGIAAMLAVLDSNDLKHGKIECLFTVDEETGLTGAMALEPNFISGNYMLNLDSEDDGELYIGCAGGIDTVGEIKPTTESIGENQFAFSLKISNLTGGHSGDDIGKGYQSATVLLAKFLSHLNETVNIQLASVDAGNLRNAIARDAEVVFLANKKHKESVRVEFNITLSELEHEIKMNDKSALIRLESCDLPNTVVTKPDSDRLIKTMFELPHGVIEMSERIAGFVKTSTNFASIKIHDGVWVFTTSQRSSSNESKTVLANKVCTVFKTNGLRAIHENDYPGWESQPDSKLIEIAKDSYQRLFNTDIKIKEIHAGLECGIISNIYPKMEIISFGPTVKGAHSPTERIEIKAVEKFWLYLVQLLQDVN